MGRLKPDYNDPILTGYVKFFNPRTNKEHYGNVDIYGDNADKYLDRNSYVVNDAIMPQAWIVEKSKLSVVSMDDVFNYIDAECEKAYEQNEKNGFRIAVGTVFSIGVADGAAHYTITKVSKKTCKIEWRGYCPDHYYDRVLGAGGTFPISLIEPLIVKRYLPSLKRMIRFDGKPNQK